MWLTRILVPEEFGLAAIAITIVLMAGALNDAGMSSALVRRAWPAQTLTFTVFWTQLAIGFALAAIVVVAAPGLGWIFGRADAVPLIRLAAVALIANGIASVPWATLQRAERFGAIAVSETIASALAILTAVSLAVSGTGAYAALSLFVVPAVVRAGCLLISSGLRPRLRFSRRVLGSILPYALNLLGEQLINMGAQQLDRTLIGIRLGAPQLGIYHQAGQVLIIPLQLLAWGTSAALFPAFAKQQTDLGHLRVSYLGSTRLFVALVFPIYTGAWSLRTDSTGQSRVLAKIAT